MSNERVVLYAEDVYFGKTKTMSILGVCHTDGEEFKDLGVLPFNQVETWLLNGVDKFYDNISFVPVNSLDDEEKEKVYDSRGARDFRYKNIPRELNNKETDLLKSSLDGKLLDFQT